MSRTERSAGREKTLIAAALPFAKRRRDNARKSLLTFIANCDINIAICNSP
jgi:hypothetical protein